MFRSPKVAKTLNVVLSDYILIKISSDRETLSHLSLKDLQKQLNTSERGLSKKEVLEKRSQTGCVEIGLY
ncbi:hypothetical protein OSCI_830006 [Kamptonema sp. PCC 6506]|nr:hypothetical protein OSCI_830006 [Kamptonema sp. PCC 6506]